MSNRIRDGLVSNIGEALKLPDRRGDRLVRSERLRLDHGGDRNSLEY